MKIMFLNGGLANQMFQYVFYRYGQISNPGEDWYLDDSFFYVNDIHNGYELNRVFGLNPRLLSEYFDNDVWEYMIEQKKQGKSIPQLLLENEVDIRMISEYDNWRKWNPFNGRVDQLDQEFEDWMVNMEGNIYYNGYGISPIYFNRLKNLLRVEFVFPVITDDVDQEYKREIENTNSCALHVRRGDYVTLGMAGDDSKYSDMVDQMLEAEPDAEFFVFSDEIDYCESHKKEMGLDRPKKVVFVKGHQGEKAFRDMQLMSICRNMVVGNSSFSYMASLLNNSKGTKLIFRQGL